MMKLGSIVGLSSLLLLCLTTPTSHAFETNIDESNHRELSVPKFQFNLFYFVCGTEVYKCGKGKIDPKYICPTPIGTKAAVKKITASQCQALTAEARKPNKSSLLYKKNAKLCPNGARVISYTKYTTDGAGRACKDRKDCICCHNGEIGGDPHLLTYDGTAYSYHGQCDLVMAQSSEFGDGLGLRVFARTEIVDNAWSLISNAVIQIGNETIEMTNDGDIYYNQMRIVDHDLLPSALYGQYVVSKNVQMIGDIPKISINVKLYHDGKQKVRFTLFKRLLSIHVGAMEPDLNGMLGHRVQEGLIGRDGMTIISTPNDMGSEWQVRSSDLGGRSINDVEPMLFHTSRAPQYPEQCLLPSTSMMDRRRRVLRENNHHQRRAVEACSDITDARKIAFCIEDIILTGDIDLVHLYHPTRDEDEE